MNRVCEGSLKEEHRKQSQRKAVGIDGMTKAEYGEKLNENVADLINRMKQFSYKPQAVRRAYIPKANGKLRPLGIPAYEDRLVQSVMAGVLNDIYEERFLDCSYGFRLERNAHMAVREINQTIMTRKVNYVLEADIKGFFDNVDHDWLMKFLENDIADPNFLRYVKRFLSETMKVIQQSLQGHINYYGVSGNLAQIYKFWKYVKYEYCKVLNKRHQKRSMKYYDYLRIWNYYVKEPHLTKNIWNWQPKLV
jgi:retron-type reverse transcriptase